MTDTERFERWLALWRFLGQIERANYLADQAMEMALRRFRMVS